MAQARRQNPAYTREAFLEWDSRQRERWELVGGRVKRVAGGSADHNVIAGNLFALLHAALRGSPCRTFQQDMRLAPEASDDVMYPDVFVTCRAFGGKAQTLASATVIVEVRSPSSREDDYTAKWESYQRMADLRHYVIVSQDEPDAALYSRSGEADEWRFRRIEGLDARIELEALGVSLAMADIFDGRPPPVVEPGSSVVVGYAHQPPASPSISAIMARTAASRGATSVVAISQSRR